MSLTNQPVRVIGGGLAGCEAAWQLAMRGIPVLLYEMKPKKYSPAHKYPGLAELVCSNSLKAIRLESAAGLLKQEMRRFGSLILEAAELTSVSAGGALAVSREDFSDYITKKIDESELITVISEEVLDIPSGNVIIAAGPLASDGLSASIRELVGDRYLYFHDAAAPIVSSESLDTDMVFAASRYGRGEADYLNCPMDREEYLTFYKELVSAERAPLHSFELEGDGSFSVYEGCMPIEVLASRGEDTMRFGPMKPVGLIDPRTGKRPYAVVQLRKENNEGTLYNLVGFQTNLRFGEQKRVFSMIPGLAGAEFVRYGVMHRNTYLNSPGLLDSRFRLKSDPRIRFAGQITGVEGYIESAASGIFCGFALARELLGRSTPPLPVDTMMGALFSYVENGSASDFQPMGANMGILPGLSHGIKGKQERYKALSDRALSSLEGYLAGLGE